MVPTPDDLIHFVGDWPTTERGRIRQAVKAFETQWRTSADRSSTIDEAFWVVVQESPSWGPYYFAHRLGTCDSLTGRSAPELADIIEASAQEL
jgi:hypothetical protein